MNCSNLLQQIVTVYLPNFLAQPLSHKIATIQYKYRVTVYSESDNQMTVDYTAIGIRVRISNTVCENVRISNTVCENVRNLKHNM